MATIFLLLAAPCGVIASPADLPPISFVAERWRQHKKLMRRARALSAPGSDEMKAPAASKLGIGAPVAAPPPGVTWATLWGELRKSQQLDCVVPACALSLLLSASELVSPLIRGQIFDAVLQPGTTFASLWPRLRLLAAVALFGWITSIAVGVLFARARWQSSMSTRVRLMDAVLRQEPAFYDAQAPGELASRLNSEPERLQDLANRGPEKAFNAVLGVCGGAALMAFTEPRLAAAALLLKAPLLSQIAVLAGRTVGLLGALQQDALNRANALAAEALAQPQTVASLGARQGILREYGRRIGEYLKVIEQTLLTETVRLHPPSLCGARAIGVSRECAESRATRACCYLLWLQPTSVAQLVAFDSLACSLNRCSGTPPRSSSRPLPWCCSRLASQPSCKARSRLGR
jgi:hypothetical protein